MRRRAELHIAAAVGIAVLAISLLLSSGDLSAQVRRRATPPRAASSDEAQRAIRHARDVMTDIYVTARDVVASGLVPRGNCDELSGEDCFHGDRECPVCLWGDRRDMIKLGTLYDSTAARVARARPGVRADWLDWLAGQRVGVWTRLGNLPKARRAAQECQAAFWWCEALRAYVEHHDGSYETAERRFRLLLRVMRADLSCQWRDVRLFRDTAGGLLGEASEGDATAEAAAPPPATSRYRAAVCPTHEEADAFWVLADPLFTLPGNDRMTEHYARLVDLVIHEQHLEAVSDGRIRHRLSHHSDVLRHGWPTEYFYRLTPRGTIPSMRNWRPRPAAGSPARTQERLERLRLPMGGPTSPYGGFHNLIYGNGGQGFVVLAPIAEALLAPPRLFEPVAARARPRETYRPEYGAVTARPLQTGFFRRDGAPLLLVRTTAPRDGPQLTRAWQVRSWNGTEWRDGTTTVTDDTVTAWLRTPWEAQVASVEALHPDGAYRARTGNRPPETVAAVAVSSLVIVNAATDPKTLDQAARAMLPTTAIGSGRQLGGYWELYTNQTHNAALEVLIRHMSPGLVTRIFAFGRQPDRIVRWTEEMKPIDGVVARTIGLDLNALPPGDYDVALTIVLDDGTTLRTGTRVTR